MTTPQDPNTQPGAALAPNPDAVNEFHRYSDVDNSPDSHHHTIGSDPNQSSPGDHDHDGRNSKLLNLEQFVKKAGDTLTGQLNYARSFWNAGRMHMGGPAGEFSLQNRSLGDVGFTEAVGTNGARWAEYVAGGIRRWWSGGDRMTLTPTGNLFTAGEVSASYLSARAQGGDEGGEIRLEGAPNGTRPSWQIDTIFDVFRVHGGGAGERLTLQGSTGLLTNFGGIKGTAFRRADHDGFGANETELAHDDWINQANLTRHVASNANDIAAMHSGFYECPPNTPNTPTNTWYAITNVRHTNGGNNHGYMLACNFFANEMYFRHYSGGNGAAGSMSFGAWVRIGGPVEVIRSVQRGINSLSANSTVNVTIAAVNTSKVFLVVNGRYVTSSGTFENVRSRFTSATNIEFLNGSNVADVAWEVVEYA